MKNIFTAICSLILVLSLYSQEKAYTPTLLTPDNEKENLMPITQLDWEPVAGYMNIKYETQISTDANFSDVLYTLSSIKSAIKTPPLKFNTEYFWRVKAIDDNNESDWSEPRSFTTFESLNLTNPANNAEKQTPRPTIMWGAIDKLSFDGISKFEILISESEDFDENVHEVFQFFYDENDGDIDGKNSFSYIVYPLTFGKTYFWKVRAYNKGQGAFEDVSEWTDARKFTTVFFNELSKPEMDKDRNLNLAPDNNLIVKYSYIGCNYVYEIDTDENFTNPNTYISSKTTLSHDDTLLFGEKYWWRSRLEYEGLYSDWSDSWWFTIIASPDIESPANNSTLGITSKLVAKKISCVDHYTFEISTSSSFPSNNTYSVIVNQPRTKVEANLTAFSGIAFEDNTTYYWRVKAVNTRNESDWSAVRNFKFSAIGIDTYSTMETSIYPNPNDGSFNVKVESAIDNAMIRIYDLTGRVRYSENTNLVEGVNHTINTNLSKGLYILEINNNGIRVNQKFTVQ